MTQRTSRPPQHRLPRPIHSQPSLKRERLDSQPPASIQLDTVGQLDAVGPACPSRQRPRVSIITPFLNAGPFLQEAIESVLAQSYPHWELLLADDGASD